MFVVSVKFQGSGSLTTSDVAGSVTVGFGSSPKNGMEMQVSTTVEVVMFRSRQFDRFLTGVSWMGNS